MKKFFGLLMIAGMMSFVACGPSAEELAKKAEDSARVADSIAAVEQAKADSVAKVEAEAAAKAAAEQAKADSIAAAEAKPAKKAKK